MYLAAWPLPLKLSCQWIKCNIIYYALKIWIQNESLFYMYFFFFASLLFLFLQLSRFMISISTSSFGRLMLCCFISRNLISNGNFQLFDKSNNKIVCASAMFGDVPMCGNGVIKIEEEDDQSGKFSCVCCLPHDGSRTRF